MKEQFICKRLRLFTYLVKNGFDEYEVIKDPFSEKGYNWWLFPWTARLQAALDEYFSKTSDKDSLN